MTIPVIHCFDTNYVPAAAVAFLSLLEHANPAYEYRLIVLHTDITEEQQLRLKKIVHVFPHATLEFLNMEGRLSSEFGNLKNKGHFSKEMLYKLIIPDLFPRMDKAIVSDVDVLYRGDISTLLLDFEEKGADKEFLLAGVSYSQFDFKYGKEEPYLSFSRQYDVFGAQQRKILGKGIGAGLLVMNLGLMRRVNSTRAFLAFLSENEGKLVQPEQDVLNLCCYPHIKYLPPQDMVCTYLWQWTTEEERLQIENLLNRPVQVHFATAVKPWNASDCLFIEEWYSYLIRTPFLGDVLKNGGGYAPKEIHLGKKGMLKLCNGKLPFLKYKEKNGAMSLKLLGFLPLGRALVRRQG